MLCAGGGGGSAVMLTARTTGLEEKKECWLAGERRFSRSIQLNRLNRTEWRENKMESKFLSLQ